MIAFSTAEGVRRRINQSSGRVPDGRPVLRSTQDVSNDDMSPLFEAVIESTEEAVYNSLFMATSVTSEGRTVDAIPLDRVREILAKYNVGKR